MDAIHSSYTDKYMNESEIVSDKTRQMHENLNEGVVRTNNNLIVLLIFTNDLTKSIPKYAATLKANVVDVEESARTLQGYGYIYIDIREGRSQLCITPKGNDLVKKLRANLRKRL